MKKSFKAILSILVCCAMLITMMPLFSVAAELKEAYFNDFLDEKALEGFSIADVPANGTATVEKGAMKIVDTNGEAYNGVSPSVKFPSASGKVVFTAKLQNSPTQTMNFYLRKGASEIVTFTILPGGMNIRNGEKEDTFFREAGFSNGKDWIDLSLTLDMNAGTYSITIKCPTLKSEPKNTISKSGLAFRNKAESIDLIRIKSAAGTGTSLIEFLKVEAETVGEAVSSGSTSSAAVSSIPTVEVTEKVIKPMSANVKAELNNAVVLFLGNSTAYVNNNKATIDANPSVVPIVLDGRTLVPLRFVSESLGASVKWIEETSEIQMTKQNTTVVMAIDSTSYTVNSERKTMDVAPKLLDSRTFVPLRAASEAFGMQVFWDDRGLIIIGPKASNFSGAELKQGVEEVIGLYADVNIASVKSTSKVQTPLFNSGFEGQTMATPAADPTTISGIDTSYPTLNDWSKNINGTFTLQYEGGTVDQRHARIIDDPTKQNNKVLHFSLSEANVKLGENSYKGRVQSNLYARNDLQEFYYSYRWYVHPDVEKMKSFPGTYSWLTMQEYWNDGGWIKSDYFYRYSLHISKEPAVGAPLYFGITGQIKDQGSDNWNDTRWKIENKNAELPIGQWVTAEMYVKEGDAENGRFYFAITPDGGEKQVVFALATETKHPQDLNPQGLFGLNPMKVYCGQDLTKFMQSQGASIQWYYDDFKLGLGRPDFVAGDTVWQQLEVGGGSKVAALSDNNVFEAEDVIAGATEGSLFEVVEDAALSGGKGVKFSPKKADDFIEFKPNFSAGAMFKVSVGVKTGTGNGKFQFYTKNLNFGDVMDTYAAASEVKEFYIADFDYTSGGAKVNRMIFKGKNDLSSGNDLIIDYIKYEVVKK